MSWKPTGTNSVPLGTARDATDGGSSSEKTVKIDLQAAIERAQMVASSILPQKKAEGAPPAAPPTTLPSLPVGAPPQDVGEENGERKRRRRNRWGAKEETASLGAGVTTALTGAMTKEQVENYAAVVRIDEITRKLKSNDVVPADGQR
ncbi:hypothetical protein FBU59_002120, partial [Linderina macrospora]